jgi:transcription initiation factor TFIID TATA-box-binding protein
MEAKIRVCNVVASVDFGRRLPLAKVGKTLAISRGRSRFPGLVIRLNQPKTANLIFSTGKMICTGSSSEKEAKEAVQKVMRKLRRNGVKLSKKPEVKIQNIVTLLNFGRSINLEKTAKILVGTIYEPEQFPGLIYQIDKPRTVALLFSTGKAVLTGARSMREVKMAVKKLEEKLFEAEKTESRQKSKPETSAGRIGDLLKILEAAYSLCEFCNYDCEKCPYPNLGVYVEDVEGELLDKLSSLSLIENCKYGFYVKPKPEVSKYLKFSKLNLREALNKLFQAPQLQAV